MLPQARFLEFVADEAKRYPNFRLVMGARVRELVEEGGRVRGVFYDGPEGERREVRSELARSGVTLRVAQYQGRSAGELVIRSWSGGGTFALAPHDNNTLNNTQL